MNITKPTAKDLQGFTLKRYREALKGMVLCECDRVFNEIIKNLSQIPGEKVMEIFKQNHEVKIDARLKITKT